MPKLFSFLALLAVCLVVTTTSGCRAAGVLNYVDTNAEWVTYVDTEQIQESPAYGSLKRTKYGAEIKQFLDDQKLNLDLFKGQIAVFGTFQCYDVKLVANTVSPAEEVVKRLIESNTLPAPEVTMLGGFKAFYWQEYECSLYLVVANTHQLQAFFSIRSDAARPRLLTPSGNSPVAKRIRPDSMLGVAINSVALSQILIPQYEQIMSHFPNTNKLSIESMQSSKAYTYFNLYVQGRTLWCELCSFDSYGSSFNVEMKIPGAVLMKSLNALLADLDNLDLSSLSQALIAEEKNADGWILENNQLNPTKTTVESDGIGTPKAPL